MSEYTQNKKKKRHVFLWFFLTLQVLFIIWLVSGSITANHDVAACTTDACTTGAEAGSGIGIGIILFVWVAVDIIVGGTYGIYRLARR
jgi:hypothetical protein